MRLFIDAGNTRLKWQLEHQGSVAANGASMSDSQDWLAELAPYAARIRRVAVSTVVSEAKRSILQHRLAQLSSAPVNFYWAEPGRGGLINAYAEVGKMGADRWHAMYGAWHREPVSFAVIDAGSAITVDYVADDGAHVGGYILAGKQMMLRSLQQDAARIGFEITGAGANKPGQSTVECVQHGVAWLWEGMIRQLSVDCQRYGLERIFYTGGDAPALRAAGLSGQHEPDLVLAGLAAIDSEDAGS